MEELTISLDSTLSRPLYEQIYEHIKKEIQNGSLRTNEKLPSTRKLSQYLEVSRSTVTLAYEQLLSEGYVENRPNRGYYVNELEGLYRLNAVRQMEHRRTVENAGRYEYDFSPSGVDLERFPYNTWRKLSRDLLLDNSCDLFRLGDVRGEEELRSAIADYLHQARGVRCLPDQIVIGAGNDYLLMLLDAILGEKRAYAFEDPTYRKAADILKLLGNEIRTVGMDQSGMMVEELRSCQASAAYVMPSHQYPLGVVMPLKRRMQLLDWAGEKEERYIIEDDYDSEFRYKGKPIPALQGFDTYGKVIYIGTFSKSVAPAIRISFLVLPERLMSLYEERGRKFSITVPKLDQKIMTEFIRGGYYERHLNRMRSVYKSRHDVLLEALRQLQDICVIRGENAGTHILLQMKNGMTEEEAVETAKKERIRVYGLSAYNLEAKGKNDTVLLGYANVNEEEIPRAVERLLHCWGG